MCGIAGIVYADDHRSPDPMVLKGMADAIAHCGPDAEGFWIRPESASRIDVFRSSIWQAVTSRWERRPVGAGSI